MAELAALVPIYGDMYKLRTVEGESCGVIGRHNVRYWILDERGLRWSMSNRPPLILSPEQRAEIEALFILWGL